MIEGIIILATLVFGAAYGLVAYRLRGYSSEWQTKGRLLCVAMAILLFVKTPIQFMQPGTVELFGFDLTPHIFPLAFIVWSYLGLITGHGRYYTLGYEPRPVRKDNWPALLPRLLGLPRDSWGFDMIALAITGLAFTLPAVVWLGLSGHYAAAVVLYAAGLSKASAYEASWQSGWKTEGGEFMHGATLGAAFATAILLAA